MARNCGVLNCGREDMTGGIPCTPQHWPNRQARPAVYRAMSVNGSIFLCCEECRPKYGRQTCLSFEELKQEV